MVWLRPVVLLYPMTAVNEPLLFWVTQSSSGETVPYVVADAAPGAASSGTATSAATVSSRAAVHRRRRGASRSSVIRVPSSWAGPLPPSPSHRQDRRPAGAASSFRGRSARDEVQRPLDRGRERVDDRLGS